MRAALSTCCLLGAPHALLERRESLKPAGIYTFPRMNVLRINRGESFAQYVPTPQKLGVCRSHARSLRGFHCIFKPVGEPVTIERIADLRRVSEWLAATLEMWCPARGCEFESRALRSG